MSESKQSQEPVQLRKRFIIVPGLGLLALLVYVGYMQIREYASAQKAAADAGRREGYQTAFDNGDLETALTMIDAVIENADSTGIRDHYRLRRAHLNHKLGNDNAAFAELDQLTETEERDGALKYRADLYFKIGRKEAAVRDLELIPMPARGVSHYRLLGMCKLSEPDEAISVLTEGIERLEHRVKEYRQRRVKERLPILYDLRGTAYLLTHEPELALADLNVVVEAGSPTVTTLAIRARAFVELRRLDEARADLANAMATGEGPAFLLNTQALIQIAEQDLMAAERTLKECLRKFPDDAEAKTGLMLIRVGDGEGTEEENSRAMGAVMERVLEQVLHDQAKAP